MYAAVIVLTLCALGDTLWHGISQPGVALAFGVLIAVGELARWGAPKGPSPLPGERDPAPLGSAGALAYALLGQNAGHTTSHGVLQIVAVVVAAALAGAVPHVARGHGPTL
ncbi:MAG TPA: metal-dependent phosphohydrolase, partial [Streptomyces sp.]|nr:metal-dependent phosphohydrolase [Streptomyces sp.]